MKDYWEEPKIKKINKNKILISIIILIFLIIFITISIIYINNKQVREWMDKNIFQKEKTQNNLPSVEISENNNIYAFNKYIGVLNKNNFVLYNNTGKKENEITLEITKPIFNTNSRYLVIAEEKGQKIYLITEKEIAWEREIEGNISQVSVNKNGYVAITVVDTSYKTVVEMFDNQGNPLFKTYLKSSRVVATTISNDDKYLAISEIDASGTKVQSNIKIISIEDAKNKPENSIKKVFNGENGDLITNIKYQDKNKIICMYTNKITSLNEDGVEEILQQYDNRKISFASIELENHSITVEEKASGIFTADSVVNIVNSGNKNSSIYIAEAVTKEIYTSNNIIALNLGAEVKFISTSGWLIKKYIAEQEITNIVLSESIAGIVYRDKIEIINL